MSIIICLPVQPQVTSAVRISVIMKQRVSLVAIHSSVSVEKDLRVDSANKVSKY